MKLLSNNDLIFTLFYLKDITECSFECDSGGSSSITKSQEIALGNAHTSKGEMDAIKPDVDNKIQTARERYLARKGGKK